MNLHAGRLLLRWMLWSLLNQLAVKFGAQLGIMKHQREERLCLGHMSIKLTTGTTVNDCPCEWTHHLTTYNTYLNCHMSCHMPSDNVQYTPQLSHVTPHAIWQRTIHTSTVTCHATCHLTTYNTHLNCHISCHMSNYSSVCCNYCLQCFRFVICGKIARITTSITRPLYHMARTAATVKHCLQACAKVVYFA